jgi:hypothetical protein
MTYSELSDLSSAKYLKGVRNFSIRYSFVSDINPLEGFTTSTISPYSIVKLRIWTPYRT